MKTKIWYSILNNGDGSASLHLMESEKLAALDQATLEDPGWADVCMGSIEIEHTSPISIKTRVITVEEVIAEVEEDLEDLDKDVTEDLKLLTRKLGRLRKIRKIKK